MKFLWIEIENKTDILAAAAFLMSIIGLVSQVAMFLRGPNVKLYTPEQVLITEQLHPDGIVYARIAAVMIYRNSGSPGYHDTLKREFVTFKLGDQKYRLVWDEFIDSTFDREDPNKLVINRRGEALPVQVNAGIVVSHETYFAPWVLRGEQNIKSFIEWPDFKARLAKQDELHFTFSFETYGGKTDSVECFVKVPEFIDRLDRGWSAPVTYQ